MLINNSVYRESYVGNGVQTQFPVPFPFLQNAHLAVDLQNPTDAVPTRLTLNTHYTVTGAGVEAGGVVTLLTAPVTNAKLVIYRNVPYTQGYKYNDLDNFPAESHENALALLTMQCQQLQEQVDRAVVVSSTSSSNPKDLLQAIFISESNSAASAAAAAASEMAAAASETAALAAKTGAETAEANTVALLASTAADVVALQALTANMGKYSRLPISLPSTQALAASTTTILNTNAAVTGTLNATKSGSTLSLMVPDAGDYEVRFDASVTLAAAPASTAWAYIYKNGAQLEVNLGDCVISQWRNRTMEWCGPLNAGDVIDVRMQLGAAGSVFNNGGFLLVKRIR